MTGTSFREIRKQNKLLLLQFEITFITGFSINSLLFENHIVKGILYDT